MKGSVERRKVYKYGKESVRDERLIKHSHQRIANAGTLVPRIHGLILSTVHTPSRSRLPFDSGMSTILVDLLLGATERMPTAFRQISFPGIVTLSPTCQNLKNQVTIH